MSGVTLRCHYTAIQKQNAKVTRLPFMTPSPLGVHVLSFGIETMSSTCLQHGVVRHVDAVEVGVGRPGCRSSCHSCRVSMLFTNFVVHARDDRAHVRMIN